MRLELPSENRQTRLDALSERMREARSNSRSGIYLNIMGAAVISAGIVLSLFAGFNYAVFCALIGLMVTVIGFYFAVKYGRECSSLKKEFEEIIIQIPKCGSCERELPQGDFWACPFCGKSIHIENNIDKVLLVPENLESSLLS